MFKVRWYKKLSFMSDGINDTQYIKKPFIANDGIYD